MAITATAAALVVSAGSTYESYRQGKAAQRAQENRFAIEQRASEIQRARERRQAIAASQEQQAGVIAGAVARGAGGGSSGAQGEVSSISSQVASNIGFASTEAQLSDAASAEGAAANKAQGKAATFQALGELPGQLGIQPHWTFQ